MRKLEGSLAVLGALTSRWREGEAADELTLAAYTAKLREQPADIALHVINSWADNNHRWPEWAHLYARMAPWRREREKLCADLAALEGEWR